MKYLCIPGTAPRSGPRGAMDFAKTGVSDIPQVTALVLDGGFATAYALATADPFYLPNQVKRPGSTPTASKPA